MFSHPSHMNISKMVYLHLHLHTSPPHVTPSFTDRKVKQQQGQFGRVSGAIWG